MIALTYLLPYKSSKNLIEQLNVQTALMKTAYEPLNLNVQKR